MKPERVRGVTVAMVKYFLSVVYFGFGTKKCAPVPCLGRERMDTLRGATQIQPVKGPSQLLLRGAGRGCFHPRWGTVFASPAGARFQPVSRLSGAGGGEGTPVSFMAVVLPILWHSGPLVKR